jgi:hypothetical protein
MFPLTLLTTLIAPVMFHGGVFVTERKRQVMRGTNCSAEKQIPPTAARERRDTRTVLARTAWDSRKTQKASIHSPWIDAFCLLEKRISTGLSAICTSKCRKHLSGRWCKPC